MRLTADANSNCKQTLNDDAVKKSTLARFGGVLVGASIGGAGLGALGVAERFAFHSQIYGNAHEMALHATAGLLSNSLGSVLSYSALWSAIRIFGIWRWSPGWRNSASVGAIAGSLTGAVAYWYVLAFTRMGTRFSLTEGCLIGAAVNGMASALGLVVFERVIRRWPKTTLVSFAAIAASVLAFDLHGNHRIYGNVSFLLEIWLLVAAGFLGARWLLSVRAKTIVRLGLGVVTLWVAGALLLWESKPTPGARIAILRYGGFEKTFIRQILWPMSDKDHDGFSQGFWGTDCDDTNFRINPIGPNQMSPYLGCRPHQQSQLAVPPQPSIPKVELKPRSLLWILVDTLRADAALPHMHLFPGFTMFPQYRSCGSSTREALRQLFGSAGCRPAIPHGSLVSELKSSTGHSTARFSTVETLMPASEMADVFGSFDEQVQDTDEQQVKRKALTWIREQEAQHRTYFALVHFMGGHRPYSTVGDTEWERYINTVDAELNSVSEFVADISPTTAVVIVGDHGEEFGEHDGGNHALTLYEEVLAVPLLVRGSKFSAGEQSCKLGCPGLVALAYQTAAGVEATSPVCEGIPKGRFAMLDYPATFPRESRHLRSLETPSGIKIIWDLNLGIWEMYDVHKDPHEMRNLVTSELQLFDRASSALVDAMRICSQ